MIRSLLTRRGVGAAAAVLGLALGGASVAWACSTQPSVRVEGSSKAASGQTSGPAGSQINFSGRDFGPGQVQVRWNSRTGQLLAEAQGPSFSVPVTIPQAPAGVHYIVAFQTVGTATASLAFEVTPSRTATPQDSGGTTSSAVGGADEEPAVSGSAQQPAGDNSTATSSTANSTTSGTEPTATQSATGSIASAPSGSEPAPVASNQVAPPAKGSAPASGTAAAAPLTERQTAASANPAVVTTPAGQAVFGGSSAASGALADAKVPSSATASGDTWSGFAAGAKPSLLTDGLTTSSSAPSNSASAVGIGLLGAGLVALFAGFAAAESARKRAVSGAEGR